MNGETVFELTNQKVVTDLSKQDAINIFSFVENISDLQIRTLSINLDNFLEVPKDRREFFGANVLRAKENNYRPLQIEIEKQLVKISLDEINFEQLVGVPE